MLRVNQLSGFGGTPPDMLIASAQSANTDTPSFLVNLGPPGLKQVICAFASHDVYGNDPWSWGIGAVGGEPFTFVIPGGDENAGNGGALTAGATIRSLQTSLGGEQAITCPIVGFSGIMDTIAMLAFVVRGFNPTPISYDNGDNQTGATGNNVSLNTVGARLVLVAAGAASAPGSLQGPGSEITEIAASRVSIGYDLLPAGGAADVYSFTGGKYVIAGAAFG